MRSRIRDPPRLIREIQRATVYWSPPLNTLEMLELGTRPVRLDFFHRVGLRYFPIHTFVVWTSRTMAREAEPAFEQIRCSREGTAGILKRKTCAQS
jgi:hypothetical protein